MRVNRVPEARLTEEPKCGHCHAPLLDGKPTALSTDSFETFVARSDLPVVVDFWAEWCGPCKGFAPVFAQAADEQRLKLRFAKLDTDAQPDIARRYAIRSIPTMVMFRNGSEVKRQSGALQASHITAWTAA